MRQVSALLVAALVAACGSTGKSEGQKQIEDLTGQIHKLSGELDEGKGELKGTMTEHDAIVNNVDGDLLGHYKRYVKGIERVESRREDVRARVEKMKSAATLYFARWKDDNAMIADQSLRERDARNLEATRARYDEIHKRGEEAKTAYDPILKTMKGHRQFWANNLNVASAAELKKDGEKLNGDATRLYTLIDATIGAAKKYNESVAMRVAPPPAEKPAQTK